MNPKDGEIYLNPAIAFEYAGLGDLERYIQKASAIKGSHGLISENSARLIFYSIVEALKYLEGKGLTHNDIKPENILIDQNGVVNSNDFCHCCLGMGIDGKGLIGLGCVKRITESFI